MAKRFSLEGVHFHDLGHSSVAFTIDCYSHIIEGMQENAMALPDEVLPAGKMGQNKINAS